MRGLNLLKKKGPMGIFLRPESVGIGVRRIVLYRNTVDTIAKIIDVEWYLSQCDNETREKLEGASSREKEIAQHYIDTGAALGISPVRTFSTFYYRNRYAEVGASNPLIHYLTHGAGTGLMPHPLLKEGTNLRPDKLTVKQASPQFDPAFYLSQYDDVARARVDPLRHYFCYGMREGRKPNPDFDPAFYRSQAGDIPEVQDPFAHFVVHGAQLGLRSRPSGKQSGMIDGGSQSVSDVGLQILAGKIRPLTNITDEELVQSVALPNWYLSQVDFRTWQKLSSADNVPEAVTQHYLSEGRELSFLPGFSPTFYRSRNGASLADGQEPLIHFLREGIKQRLVTHPLLKEGAPLPPEPGILAHASPLFDANWYLEVNQDVASTKVDPLYHYLLWGAKEGRSPHPLFDSSFYLSQLPSDVRPVDAFCHYINAGWRDRLSPHPLFDVEHYLEVWPAAASADVNPLEHYVRDLSLSGISTHPLFDANYYRSQLNGALGDEGPIVHFLKVGKTWKLDPHPLFNTAYAETCGGLAGGECAFLNFLKAPLSGIGFHPLFDVAYYLKQLRNKGRGTTNPLLDYLKSGSRDQLSPHILFDVAYYQSQIGEADRLQPALMHYLTKGWRSDLSPHPLFDPVSFRRRADRRRWDSCPLVEYMQNPRGMTPHFLFDEEYYRDSVRYAGEKPALQFYLEDVDNAKVSTHLFFDPVYYVDNVKRKWQKLHGELKGESLKRLEEDLSVLSANSFPLWHYASTGFLYGISTHRSFDPEFYAEEADLDIQSDLMRHYLLEGGMQKYSPHPAIALDFYEKSAIGFDRRTEPVFQHFIRTPKTDRVRTNRVINPDFYFSNNPDLIKHNVCAIEHFIMYGLSEARKPNPFFTPRHIDVKFADKLYYNQSSLWEYCARVARNNIPRILFIGHDATRTGAPLILLKLIETMGANYAVEPYVILGGEGALVPDFQAAAHCYVMRSGLDRGFLDGGVRNDKWVEELELLLSTFPGGPDLVICNTAETRAFSSYFFKRGVPVYNLIHEAADFYNPQQFTLIYENSTRIIFPSNYTMNKADRKASLRNVTATVRGQGLLEPTFGKGMSRPVARRLIERELRLDEHTRIVIGCGTSDLRKGIDLFASVAVKTLQHLDDPERPIYFVWIGDSRSFTGPDAWARRHIEQSGLKDRVLFMGPRSDPERFFSAADAFLLTSRMDPFPCVVHEAMACGLPIIGFEGCSGGPEAFLDSGVTVEAENPQAMVDALVELLVDDERRSSMGVRARELIDKKWSFKSYVDDVVALCESDLSLSFRLEKEEVSAPLISRNLKKGKVFFSSPDWGISGVNTFTEHLIGGLGERGFDASLLFTYGRSTYLPPRDKMPKVPCTFLPVQTGHHNEVWAALSDFLTRQRPCIYVPNYDYVASALSPVIDSNVGVVGIAHSDDVEHYEHVNRLGRYWDRIVSVSEYIAEKIGELNPNFIPKTRNIYYGVPFDEASARSRVDAINPSADKPIVLTYTGRIVKRQKNALAFADLAERLALANIPFRLNLLGAGEQYDELYTRLSGLIEAGTVEMPGRLSPKEIDEYLNESDAFVLLSDFEGLPLSMLEAMAKGVIPVVRDMKSGIPEVIESGRNGFIVPRHDLNAMVDVIRDLQAAPARRRTLGHAVIDGFIAHGLSRDAMADAYAELFSDLFAELADRKEPRPEPLAYNAPVFGIEAPPFLQMR